MLVVQARRLLRPRPAAAACRALTSRRADTRGWEQGSAAADSTRDRTTRKCNVALGVGFVGSRFHGLQEQPDHDSVERHLRLALLATGAVDARNGEDLGKVGWSRSSRTDKGVHAALTVISAKLLVDKGLGRDAAPAEHAPLVAELNAALPADVRVFSVAPVPRKFRARDACTLRDYAYFVPISALRALEPPVVAPGGAAEATTEATPELAPEAGVSQRGDGEPFTVERHALGALGARGGASADAALLELLGGAGDGMAARVEAFRETLQLAEGTHSFHNFTSSNLLGKLNKKAAEKAARRVARAAPCGSAEQPPPPSSAGPELLQKLAGEAGGAASAGAAAGSFRLPNPTLSEAGAAAGSLRLRALHPSLRRTLYRCRCDHVVQLVPAAGGQHAAPEPHLEVRLQADAFLMQQIRKIVGGAVAVASGALPAEAMSLALQEEVPYALPVPVAPGEPLVLVGSQYHRKATQRLRLSDRADDVLALAGGRAAAAAASSQLVAPAVGGGAGGGGAGGGELERYAPTHVLLDGASEEAAAAFLRGSVLPEIARLHRGGALWDEWRATHLGRVAAALAQPGLTEAVGAAHASWVARAPAAAAARRESGDKRRRLAAAAWESEPEKGSKYSALLPRNMSTALACHFGVAPGRALADVQRGLAARIGSGELAPDAPTAEILALADVVGLQALMAEGAAIATADTRVGTASASSRAAALLPPQL